MKGGEWSPPPCTGFRAHLMPNCSDGSKDRRARAPVVSRTRESTVPRAPASLPAHRPVGSCLSPAPHPRWTGPQQPSSRLTGGEASGAHRAVCLRAPQPDPPLTKVPRKVPARPAPTAPASLQGPPNPHVLCQPCPLPLPAARGHIPRLSTFHRPWAFLSTFHCRHVTHQNSPQSPDPMSPPPGAVICHLCHRLTPGTTMKRQHSCPGAWPQPLSPHLCPLYPTDSPPGGQVPDMDAHPPLQSGCSHNLHEVKTEPRPPLLPLHEQHKAGTLGASPRPTWPCTVLLDTPLHASVPL